MKKHLISLHFPHEVQPKILSFFFPTSNFFFLQFFCPFLHNGKTKIGRWNVWLKRFDLAIVRNAVQTWGFKLTDLFQSKNIFSDKGPHFFHTQIGPINTSNSTSFLSLLTFSIMLARGMLYPTTRSLFLQQVLHYRNIFYSNLTS